MRHTSTPIASPTDHQDGIPEAEAGAMAEVVSGAP